MCRFIVVASCATIPGQQDGMPIIPIMITTKLNAAQPQRSFTYLIGAAILLDGYDAFTNGDPFGVVLCSKKL